jgi:hypothetical protein
MRGEAVSKRMGALEAAEVIAGFVRQYAREQGREVTLEMCEGILNELKATGDLPGRRGNLWLKLSVAPYANAKTIKRLARES